MFRTFIEKIGQARRLIVRAELTLTALQATFWLALAAASAGGVLLVRRRLTSGDDSNNALVTDDRGWVRHEDDIAR
jgi:hypothetical protein